MLLKKERRLGLMSNVGTNTFSLLHLVDSKIHLMGFAALEMIWFDSGNMGMRPSDVNATF